MSASRERFQAITDGGRCLEDLGGGTGTEGFALRQDEHPVAERDEVFRGMTDVNQGYVKVVPDALEKGEYRLLVPCIEAAQRLVEQEEARRSKQRPGERHALAFAARKGCDATVEKAFDIERLRNGGQRKRRTSGGGPKAARLGLSAAILQVLLYAEVREKGPVLRHVADAAMFGRDINVMRSVHENTVVQLNPACVWATQTGDRLDEGGLSGPGIAEQTDGPPLQGEGKLEAKASGGKDEGIDDELHARRGGVKRSAGGKFAAEQTFAQQDGSEGQPGGDQE